MFHIKGRAPIAAVALIALPFVATTARADRGALFELGQYMTKPELVAHHPFIKNRPIYHGSSHSLQVARVMARYARARRLTAWQQRFLGQVALIHDWDPARTPGTPPSVLRTLRAMADDFAGRRSLIGGNPGESVLRQRFGWGKRELRLAMAMIQRTEFPFGVSHPNPGYAKRSPRARYKQMLSRLSREDQRFVLREAAILSEYADKGSSYMTKSFNGALRTVDGLVHEINAAAKAEVTSIGRLGTPVFLASIGKPAAFAEDHAIARELVAGKIAIPGRAAFFAAMPRRYATTFEANLRGFRALDGALKRGLTPRAAKQKALVAQARYRLAHGRPHTRR